jgi:hypothetical protein
MPVRNRELYSTNGAQYTSPGQRPGFRRFMNPEPCWGEPNGGVVEHVVTRR